MIKLLKVLISVLMLFIFVGSNKVVKVVKIGNQQWMVENLTVSTFRNGDFIPEVKTFTDLHNFESDGKPAWCYYNSDPQNGNKYGKLYNWYAVNDPRGLAPKGWHVPSDVEWKILIDYLGGSSVAGGKMKENGTNHWENPNIGATNESGFSALPGGNSYMANKNRYKNEYIHLGKAANFWSSTEYNSDWACYWQINHLQSNIFHLICSKKVCYSVRCLKD